MQQLLVALQLPDAHLAAQLGGGGAEALQGEGAEQGPGAAAPHAGERHLLGNGTASATGDTRGKHPPTSCSAGASSETSPPAPSSTKPVNDNSVHKHQDSAVTESSGFIQGNK